MKGDKKIFRVLSLAVAILAAGQTAWATTKTVSYRITDWSLNSSGTEYDIVFTRSGDIPFNTASPTTYTASVHKNSISSPGSSSPDGSSGVFSVELADGFNLSLEWSSGSNVRFLNNCIGVETENKYITYTVSCSNTNYYYVTHVMLTGMNSNYEHGLLQPAPHYNEPIDYDFDNVWGFSQSYQSRFDFGQITITYSDAPSLSIFEPDGENTYKIQSKEDLRHLANYVNKGHNDCSGLTFRQTQPITCDNTYVPIGYYKTNSDKAWFCGTYDGQGKTVSGITVTRTGNTSASGYIGLFGFVDKGTVENVVLANSTFTGSDCIGGIVGYNFGTVRNCRVESSVTIKAGCSNAMNHGGIVGFNDYISAKIIGCVSAASIQNNGRSDHTHCGGIAGRNYVGTIQDCLYTGSTVEAANKKGTIVGLDEDNAGSFTNNYYTSAINLGGVGTENSSSDQNGARRALTVTLGDNVALVGDETAYSVSGLTAIGSGNYALRYNDGTTTKIYSGEGQTLTLAYTGSVPTSSSVVYTVKNSGGSDITADVLSGATLTMPAFNVTISATVAATTVATTYIDADGNSREVTALPLLGTETELGIFLQETWYVVNSDVSYDHEVKLYGDVHLILADGKTMTMTVSDDNKWCIWCDVDLGRNLTIYGQSDGTGMLNATSENHSAINGSGTLTVNGGRITAIAKYTALGSRNSVTINGGVINATSQNQVGIFCTYGIITINGGQVETNGMGSAQGSIILGYRNANDYIMIGSRGVYSYYLYIAAGKSMTDGTNTYTAPANYNMLIDAELANVTLRPVIPASVELTLAQGTKDGVTAYWGTFYNSVIGYSLPAGATAYTMDENKNLYRLGTDGSMIPKGVPVVIISEVADITLTKVDGEIIATDNAPGGNILLGTNGLVELDGYKVDGKIPYVLSVSNGAIGFRQFVGTGSDPAIPAHKAYYLVTP